MPEDIIVVSNVSPIMNLAIICQLDILRQFFSEVYIPQSVWREVVVKGIGKGGTEKVKEAKWIKVVEVEDTPLLQLLKRDIDEGEAETIAYAVQSLGKRGQIYFKYIHQNGWALITLLY